MLPGVTVVDDLIEPWIDRRLVGTGFIYEFILMRDFADTCLQVYFSETFSDMDFIIVNAGLYSLFGDYSHHVPSEEKHAHLGHADTCLANLETTLSSLPLHLPATSDAVTALRFGAWHAIELSKPYLSWALSNKGSEQCQTLNYHRMPDTDNGDDAKFKKFLFWTNYFLDKSLSLRLGRASTIPNWDITTHRPLTNDPCKEPGMAYYVLWVESARCQGNIYQLLYSPEAVSQPGHVRSTRAQLLVDNLRTLEGATQETDKKWMQISKDNAGKDLMDFFATSDGILRLSLLTLVLRAAPQPAGAPTTFSPSCTEAARATLHRHQDCMAIIEKSSEGFLPTYVHWTLLFAPFIPFIVVFCQVLHGVAARYVGLSARYGDGQPQDTEDRGMYLRLFCALSPGESSGSDQHRQGPAHDLGGGEFAQGVDVEGISTTSEEHAAPMLMNPMMRMSHGAQLEEWFYSNQALMESFQTFSHGFPTAEG
ncbi:hypothetical protein FJTKL_14221 [Diaporthe vaccinii]|uniref:Xylanolytic transcriptional activator regulatory domain-containing protein n=1 Tax=Diaporthe vaccinii TaxID=105482 RepID=A0ABR4E8L6_9PEZI